MNDVIHRVQMYGLFQKKKILGFIPYFLETVTFNVWGYYSIWSCVTKKWDHHFFLGFFQLRFTTICLNE